MVVVVAAVVVVVAAVVVVAVAVAAVNVVVRVMVATAVVVVVVGVVAVTVVVVVVARVGRVTIVVTAFRVLRRHEERRAEAAAVAACIRKVSLVINLLARDSPQAVFIVAAGAREWQFIPCRAHQCQRSCSQKRENDERIFVFIVVVFVNPYPQWHQRCRWLRRRLFLCKAETGVSNGRGSFYVNE
jgi:hypothetical protein